MSEPRETPNSSDAQQLSIRRAPKVPVFLVLGALVGLIVALVATTAFDVDPLVGFAATFGYLCVYFIPAGIVLGALVALALDARSRRRSRTVAMEHESVHESTPEPVHEAEDLS